MSFCSSLSSPQSISLFSKPFHGDKPVSVSLSSRIRASADVPDFLSADWLEKEKICGMFYWLRIPGMLGVFFDPHSYATNILKVASRTSSWKKGDEEVPDYVSPAIKLVQADGILIDDEDGIVHIQRVDGYLIESREGITK
ncbi:hypothetical protein AAG906_007762 [Vitis piasezkii]